MNFQNIRKHVDSICPLLSIGQEYAVACHPDCAWRNEDSGNCDISTLADVAIHNPDAMETIRRNDAPE